MAGIDAGFAGEIFRKDKKVVIATNRQLASLLAVRLAYDAAGYEAGRILARNTVSGLHQKYVNGGASGTGVAVCVLHDEVLEKDFASSGDTQSAAAVFGGEVLESACVGLDANAKNDLKGRSITDAAGSVIFKF
jgi:hypothetical protein